MSLIEIVFGRRKQSDPPGRSNSSKSSLDDHDIEDSSEERDPRFDGWRIWIRYSDFEGATSERWVRVYRIASRQFNDYLVGHCELRNATRTFRVDRIMEVADRDGEIHDARDFFQPYLSDVKGRSAGPDRHRGFGRALHIIDQIGDDLKMLAFISESDVRMGNKEADIIMKYAALRAQDLGLDFSKADTVDLRRWMKLQNPDVTTMRSSIARIAKRKTGTFDDLWDMASIVVEIDGKIHDAELAAMNELRGALEEEFAAAASQRGQIF